MCAAGRHRAGGWRRSLTDDRFNEQHIHGDLGTGWRFVCRILPGSAGANGQGRSKQDARESLADAIALIFEDRREDALRGLPEDAERGTVAVR